VNTLIHLLHIFGHRAGSDLAVHTMCAQYVCTQSTWMLLCWLAWCCQILWLLCICEVLGSYLGSETCYFDERFFSCCFSGSGWLGGQWVVGQVDSRTL